MNVKGAKNVAVVNVKNARVADVAVNAANKALAANVARKDAVVNKALAARWVAKVNAENVAQWVAKALAAKKVNAVKPVLTAATAHKANVVNAESAAKEANVVKPAVTVVMAKTDAPQRSANLHTKSWKCANAMNTEKAPALADATNRLKKRHPASFFVLKYFYRQQRYLALPAAFNYARF
jgi:hypothetical protein